MSIWELKILFLFFVGIKFNIVFISMKINCYVILEKFEKYVRVFVFCKVVCLGGFREYF